MPDVSLQVRNQELIGQARTLGLVRADQSPAEAEASLERLVTWANENGLQLDRLASPADLGGLTAWARQNGWREGTPLLSWAETRGFAESDNLGVVHGDYQTLATTISADGVNGTAIANEAVVTMPAHLAGGSALIAATGELVAIATADSSLSADAAAVLATVLGPPPAALAAVSGAVQADVSRIATELAATPTEANAKVVGTRIGRLALGSGIDVNALVQQVLREAYADQLGDLRAAAEKVKFYNDLKKKMREELEKARQALAAAPSDAMKPDSDIALTYGGVSFDATPAYDEQGKPIVRDPTANDAGAITNKEQLRAYIQNLESQLSTVGEDAQLANMDLQNIMQKQQQLLQTMSSISRIVHEAAMSVIRNIQ